MSTVWKTLLALLGMVVVGLSLGRFAGLAQEEHRSPAPARLPGRTVVGFGHVDVEEGVTPLSVSVTGQVAEVLVHEGERVSAGAPLVRLRQEQAQAQLAQAEAAVREADVRFTQASQAPARRALEVDRQEQAVAVAQSRAESQQHQLDRLRPLADQGDAVPKENYDSAKQRLRELQAALASERLALDQLRLADPQEEIALAQAARDAARAQLQMAQDQLARHTLAAPQDGTALRVLVSPGQVLGTENRQPAIWFCPAVRRIVRCEIDQEFAERVRPGLVAQVHPEGNGSTHWKGKVHRCAGWIAVRRSLLDEPLQRNDVRTLECIIVLEGDPPNLRIGQRMRVIIHAEP